MKSFNNEVQQEAKITLKVLDLEMMKNTKRDDADAASPHFHL